MKNLSILLLLSIFSFGFTTSEVHKFYTSLTEIDYLTDKREIQVALKIFTDDLEDAIKKDDGKQLYLDTSKEIENTDAYLKKYLLNNFTIKIKEKQQTMQYAGKEYIDDATWVYFKYSDLPKRIKSISITNNVIISLHRKQKNLINFKKDRKLFKSSILKKGSSTMIIKF